MTTQTPQSFSNSGAGVDPAQTVSEGGASVRERATQVGGTAKDEASGVAQEVTYQARDLAGEARIQVRQQVDVQKGRLSDLLRDIGEELDQMADRSDRNGIASDLARQAASRTRDVRGYLDGGGDLVDDVRRFARRRPGTFLLGALAAGVIAGRATRAATAAKRRTPSGGGSPPVTGNGTATFAGSAYPGTYAGGSAGYEGAYGGAGSAQGDASPGDATPGAEIEDPEATYDTTTGYGSGYSTRPPPVDQPGETPIASTTYADPATAPESLPLRGETERAEGFAPPNGGERT